MIPLNNAKPAPAHRRSNIHALPHRTPRQRILPILLALTIGISISVFAFLEVRDRESRAMRTGFTVASENHVSAVKREIASNLAAVNAFGAYAGVATPAGRAAFDSFAQQLIHAYPSIL